MYKVVDIPRRLGGNDNDDGNDERGGGGGEDAERNFGDRSGAAPSLSFERAIERYIDENKPDPLVRKQIQSWTMEWKPSPSTKEGFSAAEGDEKQKRNKTKEGEKNSQKQVEGQQRQEEDPCFSFRPSHVLQGTVLWSGKHAVVELDVLCYWRSTTSTEPVAVGEEQTSNNTGKKKPSENGSLFFSCRPRARLLDEPRLLSRRRRRRQQECQSSEEDGADTSQQEEENEEMTDKEKEAELKAHDRLRQRLSEDDYVRKILVDTNAGSEEGKKKQKKGHDDDENNGDDRNDLSLLCEATIHFGDGGVVAIVDDDDGDKHEGDVNKFLEERVHCNGVTAEALRRLMFSTAPDGPMDVFDLILSLPVLPCTAHQVNGDGNKSPDADRSSFRYVTTNLADRARLRMLEDVMYDACEEHGEEEMVQELRISKKQRR